MTPQDLALGPIFFLGLVVTLGYSSTCVIWPFKSCRHCHGTGRLRSPVVRAVRLCPTCEATGLRIRVGRHLWNQARRIHRANRRRNPRR